MPIAFFDRIIFYGIVYSNAGIHILAFFIDKFN